MTRAMIMKQVGNVYHLGWIVIQAELTFKEAEYYVFNYYENASLVKIAK
jgi:hypothetical protein